MARWQPDARGRIAKAAMELYSEQGFDQTTVAAIAERAGLTERTFFRHFADKREVFFVGSDRLTGALTLAVDEAPDGLGALELAQIAIDAITNHIDDREFSGKRQAIIDGTPELRERELIKLAGLASDLAAALRGRGVTDPAAGLAAESGVAAFKVAFFRWLDSDDDRTFTDHADEAFVELRALTAA